MQKIVQKKFVLSTKCAQLFHNSCPLCFIDLFWRYGNSMSNHPGHDTLTLQILLIFSPFVGSVQMINP